VAFRFSNNPGNNRPYRKQPKYQHRNNAYSTHPIPTVAHSDILGDSISNSSKSNSYRFRGFDTECLRIVRYDLGGRISERTQMVMKFEELVLVAALAVG
jgi:hypothetical protein